jgi:polysaccharide export outer membrane protein
MNGIDPPRRIGAAAPVLAVILALAATPLTAQSNAQSGDDAFAYRIGPQDSLRIEVAEAPQLSATETVGTDGALHLRYLGEVPVEGLTVDEVAAELERRYESQVVTRATVTVQVLEARSRPVAVLGAVKSPGTLGYSPQWTLQQAIAAAGGLETEHGRTVTIQRRADNGLSETLSLPLDEVMRGTGPAARLPLFGNDIVTVEPATDVTIYLIGEIASKGARTFKSNQRITVLTVVAAAGGLTDRASPVVRIRRERAEGPPEEIEVNYRRLLAGKEDDVELRHGDALIVKESFF